MNYTLEQRLFLVNTYYENYKSCKNIYRKCINKFIEKFNNVTPYTPPQ